jgi:hypothetical protein
MAADSIKIEKKTEQAGGAPHREALGIDQANAFLGCMRVWMWFDDHTADGYARSVTLASLDHAAGVKGFAEAMRQAGWLL